MKHNGIKVHKKVMYDIIRDVYVYNNWNIDSSFACDLAKKAKADTTNRKFEEFLLKLYRLYRGDDLSNMYT